MNNRKNRLRLVILALLIVAAWAANYLKYQLFFNVDFLFGSIFTMLILQIFGWRWGALSALIASTCTWFLWNHPYAIIIFTAEAAVAGLLYERKNISLLLADMLFWLLLGMPLVLLFYGGVMHVEPVGLAVIALKQTLNGIMNALIARMVMILLDMSGKVEWLPPAGVPLRDSILNFIAAFVLIPSLIVLSISSRNKLAEVEHDMGTRLENVAEQSRVALNSWLTEHLNVVRTLAIFAARDPHIQRQLETVTKADEHFLRIGLLSRDAVTIAYAPLVDELGRSTLGKSFADRPFIPLLKQNLKPMVTEVLMGRIGRPAPMVAVVAPVVRNGQYDGYVTGIVNMQALGALLANNTGAWGMDFTLIDRNSRVIVSSSPELKTMDTFDLARWGETRQISATMFALVPSMKKNITAMERWRRSLYMIEVKPRADVSWRLVLAAPISSFQQSLNREYARGLAEVLSLFLLSALFASVISAKLTTSFSALTDLTSGLPERLSRRDEVHWPQSGLVEVRRLIDNFRAMADSLTGKFDELAEMNATLERRVEERSARLQESEAKMRALFDNAGDALFILVDGVKIIEANRAASEQYGYSHEELMSLAITDLNTPEQAKHAPLRVEAVLRNGYAVFQTEHRTKTGKVLPIEVNCRSFIMSGKQLIISSCRDISYRKHTEDALRQSQEQLTMALEGSGAGLWDWQVQTGEMVINAQWAEMLGYRLQELKPMTVKTWTRLCHPADLAASTELQRRHFARETPAYECEARMKHRDGRWIWVLDRGRVTEWDNTGRPVRMTGTRLDITERKQAEEKAKRYSHDLERLLAVSGEMTVATDLKRLYRAVVEAAKELLHLDFSTVMLLSEDRSGLTIVDTTGFPASVVGNFTLVEGQGLGPLVAKTGKPGTVADFLSETRFAVPDLVTENGIRSAVCVPLIAQETVLGILIGHTREVRTFSSDEIALYQNIANQAAIAIRNTVNLDAVRRAEKKLRDITSHIGEGLYVFDREGRITFMNNEAERLLGWTLDEMNAKGPHQLVHNMRADGSPLPIEECRMHNVSKTGKHYFSTDEVFVRKDGTVFPILVISSPIFENGKVVGSVTAFRDISDVKKLESEMLRAQKLDSIAVLAGGIAHDFNNLLQAIVGNVSLARMFAPDGTRYAERLDQAEQAASQAKELSYRLLTFSKGGEPVRTALDITRPLRESVGLALSGSKVVSEFNLPDGLDAVFADANQLRQVFHNLILNAKEAMPSGGRVRISARNLTVTRGDGFPLREGKYVLISIQDTGSGIPKKDQARIFDPYFTTKEMGSERGRGLGLAVCHSILTKHDGTVTVESEPGQGSTFHVFLPAAGRERRVEEPRVVRQAEIRGGKILLMDDEQQVQSVVGEMLRQAGYDVAIANNGEEAISLYRQAFASGNRYDVVILDLTVPGGHGRRRRNRAAARNRSAGDCDRIEWLCRLSGYEAEPAVRFCRSYCQTVRSGRTARRAAQTAFGNACSTDIVVTGMGACPRL